MKFAREHGDAFDALLANLDQSVFGEAAYPAVEAKAAHLLYFVVKNHPFSDGNKGTPDLVVAVAPECVARGWQGGVRVACLLHSSER